LQPHVCVQGNIDPLLVACAKERIVDEVNRIKNELSGGAYIFNLGHGIVPYTPIENVELLINTVRGK
jgi:uroporphyrinogen decarboxylase